MLKIDIDSWKRKEIYEMFSKIDYPFYAVTIPVEVTNLKKVAKENKLSFYYLMLWACTKAVNSVNEFNMRIYDDGIYQLDATDPSFTVMKENEETFIIVTTKYQDDYKKFCLNCKEAVDNQTTFFTQDDSYKDKVIYFSCAPWFDFTALTNERNFDKDDTIPRISWGKYYEENGKLMVHLSIDVNHRTIDGIHIAKFKDCLDKTIAKL